jgi:spermidine/putrescine transport system permease protein
MDERALATPLERLAAARIGWEAIGTVLLRGYMVAAYLFLFTPILVVVVFSFNADRFLALPWRGFTWMWYESAVRNPDLLLSLRNSVLVGTAVGATSLALGFPAAYALARGRGRWRDLYLVAVLSPLAVPWILLGLGLLVFFSSVGIPKSLVTVWISHTVFAAPLAALVIRGRLQTIRLSYEEAAWDLGASRSRALWEVVVPLAAPALASAFLMTFTLSFDEFIIAWFVSGFARTLPLRIWSMMQSGVDPSISATGALVFLVSMTGSVAAYLLQRRKVETEGGA